MRFLNAILLIFLSLGCGKKFPDYDNKPGTQEEQAPGYYTGQFSPLNSSGIKAHTILWIKGQQFYARVVMTRGQSATVYQQYIHENGRCPDKSDDSNGDGFLSASEVENASGKMLIPLDRIIKTQNEGADWFPRSSGEGMYYYSRAADITILIRDLRNLKKIENDESLDFNRRTIILYRSSSESFIPVACSELNEDVNPEE